MMSCWINPYPLIRTSNGGYSIAPLDLAWKVAFGTAFLSIILALLATGWPRILPVVGGIALMLMTFGSALQNGV
jgi:hypothetical protein